MAVIVGSLFKGDVVMNKSFNVTGSSGTDYTVTFTDDDGTIHAQCTCEAGLFGTFCKHIAHVIDTDDEVRQSLDAAGLLATYQEFNDKQKESDRLKRSAKSLKLAFAKKLLR